MSIGDAECCMEVGSVSPPSRATRRRRKKKNTTLVAQTFSDLYTLTGETLGEGSYGKVETCKNVYTGFEYAVKIIEKRPGIYNRSKVLKEIEVYHLCRGHNNIIQLIEYFEEDEHFFLIFEKIRGGPLLTHIQERVCFTESEASSIIGALADALSHLHKQGIAHRDIKPENILCVNECSPCPVKLCDFDLCSSANIDISTPRLLTPVGSVEYMAPEVVDTFLLTDDYYDEEEEELTYNKKCDMWSLGIIMYILLCGYVPFSGRCGAGCGWEKGENCPECQELLFDSIKEGRVEFHPQYWANISAEAKDLIRRLLVKDAGLRLDTAQVLQHPWILAGGPNTSLQTPANLQRQTSIKDLEDFAGRAMEVNRAVEEVSSSEAVRPIQPASFPVRIPWRRETWSFDLSPPAESTCGLLQRRRRSKHLLNRFCSIDEILDLEGSDSDALMKAI